MQTVYLDPDQVPAHWKAPYKGRTFRAVITTALNVSDLSLRWDNGSRSVYIVWDGEHSLPVREAEAWPHYGEQTIALKPGRVVVEHAVVAGKDFGVTVYAHPDDIVKSLAAPEPELSDDERAVLYATRCFKASYAGRSRREIYNQEGFVNARYLDQERWDNAKVTLIAKGLLRANGSLTTSGKNVAANITFKR